MLLGLLTGCFQLCVLPHQCVAIWPQISLQSMVRVAQHSLARFCPSFDSPTLPSFFPFSILLRQPHEALDTVRSPVLRRIDRPEQSADARPCRFPTRCVQFLPIYSATYTLEHRLVRLRNQNVTGFPTGRSLACRPPAAARMAARPGDNLRLPPANARFTCRFLLDRCTRTPHSHRTPPVGVQS